MSKFATFVLTIAIPVKDEGSPDPSRPGELLSTLVKPDGRIISGADRNVNNATDRLKQKIKEYFRTESYHDENKHAELRQFLSSARKKGEYDGTYMSALASIKPFYDLDGDTLRVVLNIVEAQTA